MTNLVGRTLANRFHVNTFLGKGGMAEVYKVWDQARLAALAIKVLNPNLAGDYVFLDHFREEARALARLQHPKIVRFYSFERDGDTAFIVMDYAEGSTLREEIRAHGALSSQRILQIMRDVCAALNYAHEMGYVHCDIKPANIILDKNGSALLSDFGIARATTSASNAITRSGTAGTMSPEQIRGESPTRASDIYALGVMLFEMLTGMRPFMGQSTQTAGSTAERVRWEQLNLQSPSPRKYNPSISPELEGIVLRCLERDASRRYPNVQSLLSALEAPLLRDASRPEVDQTPHPGTQTRSPARRVDEGAQPNHRSRNIFVWLVMSGVVIILFVLMLSRGGAGNGGISPVTPMPASRPFSIRLYNPMLDANAQPVWDMEKIEWPTQPGHYYWDVDYPVNTPLVLTVGWCASNQAILDENWLLMDYSLAIDGYEIDISQLNFSQAPNKNLFCNGRDGVLEGWSKGTHTYIQTQHIRQPLSDGTSAYDAGDYIFEFTVNVK